MNLGAKNSKQMTMAIVLGVAALCACFFIYEQVADAFGWNAASPTPAATAPVAPSESATSAAPAAPAPAAEGKPAKVVMSSAALDPTLHMEAMQTSEAVVYAGSGRNIFSPNSAPPPVVIPKPVQGPRNAPLVVTAPQQPEAPRIPPIDLKFFGFKTTGTGARQAFLLHDDTVYLASAGDVVLRRYRIVSIDARTILVEDMQNNNRQTLPLLAN